MLAMAMAMVDIILPGTGPTTTIIIHHTVMDILIMDTPTGMVTTTDITMDSIMDTTTATTMVQQACTVMVTSAAGTHTDTGDLELTTEIQKDQPMSIPGTGHEAVPHPKDLQDNPTLLIQDPVTMISLQFQDHRPGVGNRKLRPLAIHLATGVTIMAMTGPTIIQGTGET
jgi:hypothetical protein